jgi:stress response protein YsnF
MSSGMTTGSASSRRMVTAFFDDRSDAEQAIHRLQQAGIARDSIRLTAGNERDTGSDQTGTPSVGEASVGLWDSLRDLFLPDEDRATYAEGLRRGGYLVSVEATDTEHDRVLDILDDEGTIDIDERAESWRTEGWSGSSSVAGQSGRMADQTTSPAAPATAAGTSSAGGTQVSSAERQTGDDVIPIAEERLQVGKRDVSQGRVRIRSYVVETPIEEQVNLRDEHVDVQRRPVDRPIGNEDVFRERTIEMEERAEEAVVAKEARVKEELVVRKDVEERTQTVSDTVRETKVEVEDERGNTVRSTRSDKT